MTQEQKRQEWSQRIDEYESSGQTIAVWCAAHDIKQCNFNYWRRRLRIRPEDRPNQPVKWLTLDCEIPETTEQNQALDAIGVQIGQARITVRKGFDQGLFRDIVNILQML